MDFIKRTWAEINLNALDHNLAYIKEMAAPGSRILGIVKADAYGHGDIFISKYLEDAGVDWFGVSNIEEGFCVRESGAKKPILILGYTPVECAGALARENMTQAFISLEYCRLLQAEAEKQGVVVEGHIKVDTGMTRVGFQADEKNFENSLESILEVGRMPNLKITGIFTHFSSADGTKGENYEYLEMQYSRFQKMIQALEKAGMDVGIRHCANSVTTVAYPEKHLDMCRPGVIIYGLSPADALSPSLHFEPVMTLKTVVALVKEIEKGCQVGYSRTYTAPERRKIATVPIGFADGFSRFLSNNARMIVNGEYAPVVGNVCMDQVMIDVTDIPDVKIGDEVVVFGRQGDKFIPVEEVAERTGTIHYEIICAVSKRVPRVYVKDGKMVAIKNYLVK